MPVDESYRLYLEEKFKGLQSAQHGYFHEVHDKLDTIEKQTTKTNNRVTKIEEDLVEYRIIKKYPKIAVLIITIAVLGTVFGILKLTGRQVETVIDTARDDIKTEIRLMDGVSKETRGIVKFRDEMGFSDSVNMRRVRELLNN